MNKTLFFGAATLICAFTFSPVRAASPIRLAQAEHPEHSHDRHSQTKPPESEHIHHQHQMMEIPSGQPVPAVKLIVHEDPMQGWNLEIQLENFQFAPEHIAQSSLPTEGHAHLYVNGNKIARLYGNWYHLSQLPSGTNEITVSLNANGHETLTVNNQPIQDTVTIEVQP